MALYVVAALLLLLVALVAILNCGARRARTQCDGQTDDRRLVIQELFQEGVGWRHAVMVLKRAGFINREGSEFTEEQVKLEHSAICVADHKFFTTAQIK